MIPRWLAAFICLTIASCGFIFALNHVDRMATLGPNGPSWIGAAALASAAFAIAAFCLLLSLRRLPAAAPAQNQPSSVSAAGVYALVPQARYRVIREITDYYGTHFPVGEELIFQDRNFLPYHGGHTLRFHPRPMFLQEESNADILDAFELYLQRIT